MYGTVPDLRGYPFHFIKTQGRKFGLNPTTTTVLVLTVVDRQFLLEFLG